MYIHKTKYFTADSYTSNKKRLSQPPDHRSNQSSFSARTSKQQKKNNPSLYIDRTRGKTALYIYPCNNRSSKARRQRTALARLMTGRGQRTGKRESARKEPPALEITKRACARARERTERTRAKFGEGALTRACGCGAWLDDQARGIYVYCKEGGADGFFENCDIFPWDLLPGTTLGAWILWGEGSFVSVERVLCAVYTKFLINESFFYLLREIECGWEYEKIVLLTVNCKYQCANAWNRLLCIERNITLFSTVDYFFLIKLFTRSQFTRVSQKAKIFPK